MDSTEKSQKDFLSAQGVEKIKGKDEEQDKRILSQQHPIEEEEIFKENSFVISSQENEKNNENVYLKNNEKLLSAANSQASTGSETKPHPSAIKYLLVLMVSLFTLGPFVMAYGLSSVKESFMQTFNLNNVEYNYMQSGVTFVSCLSTPFAGLLIDRIGLRKSLVIFSVLCLTGYYLQTFGIYKQNFPIQTVGMAIGYAFLNCLSIIQGPLISRWVGREEYGVCVSITFVSVRLADIISSWTYPVVVEEQSGKVYLAFLLGSGILTVSLAIGSITAYILDYKAETTGYLREEIRCGSAHWSHLKFLGIDFWVVVLCGVFGYTCFYSFYFNSQSILKTNYHIGGIEAGRIYSIPFFIAFGQPIFGWLLDQMKSKQLFLNLSILPMVICYTIWTIFADCQQSECYYSVIPAYILLGIFLAAFPSAIWYAVNQVSSMNTQGTAYGILISLKSLGISAGSIGTGYIMDTGSVVGVTLYSLALAVISLGLAFFLYLKRRKTGILPNQSQKGNVTDNLIEKSPSQVPLILSVLGEE